MSNNTHYPQQHNYTSPNGYNTYGGNGYPAPPNSGYTMPTQQAQHPYQSQGNYSQQRPDPYRHSSFYSQVMMWLLIAFGAAAVGTVIIGPMIPPALIMPLSIVVIVILLVSSFVRSVSPKMSGIFAIAIPLMLGITLYPTLNYYVASGASDIVINALVGTAVVFGTMAMIGWTSEKSLDHWAGKMFAIVLGIIVLSLLNTFVLHMPMIGLMISVATLVIFSIYTFIDIQRIRDRSMGNAPASAYALNVFLDILNIFTSLLRIFGFFSNR